MHIVYSYMKKCPSRKHPSPWLSSWMFGLQWKCFLYLISCLQSKLNFVWSYFSGSCPYIWIYGWRTCLDVLLLFSAIIFFSKFCLYMHYAEESMLCHIIILLPHTVVNDGLKKGERFGLLCLILVSFILPNAIIWCWNTGLIQLTGRERRGKKSKYWQMLQI